MTAAKGVLNEAASPAAAPAAQALRRSDEFAFMRSATIEATPEQMKTLGPRRPSPMPAARPNEQAMNFAAVAFQGMCP